MVKHVSVLITVLLIASFLSSVGFIRPAQASIVTISGQWSTVWITPTTRAYCVGNNVWNPESGWKQELQVNDQTGAFTVTKSNANATHVVSYPFIYRGNHWGSATIDSGLPMQVSGLSVETSWNISTISSGVWNAAYDVWFHKTSDYNGGQFNGAELMIWISYTAENWAEKKVGTVSLAGASWDVYYWTMTSWNYIAYLRSSNTTFVSFNLSTFVTDAVSRGYIQKSWYLIAVEAGFEIWKGGVGLTSNSFSVLIPDVAITDITPSATEAYPTWAVPMGINVTITYNGDFTENFSATLYWNNTNVIGTKTFILNPQETKTLTYTWTIPNISFAYPYPKYILSANATLLSDSNPAYNILTDGAILIKWPGDATGLPIPSPPDGHVYVEDLFMFGKAWDSELIDARWNPKVDFDGDGHVYANDLYLLGKNWGKDLR